MDEWRTLSQTLWELEQTDPDVQAAMLRYLDVTSEYQTWRRAMVSEIYQGRSHDVRPQMTTEVVVVAPTSVTDNSWSPGTKPLP